MLVALASCLAMTQVALEPTPELAHIHRKLVDGVEIGWAAFTDALQS